MTLRTREPKDDEDITEPLAGGQGPNQIQVNMRKSSTQNRNLLNRSSHVGLNLSLLAAEAEPRPEPDILGQARPNKPGVQEPPGSMNARIRDPVNGLEQILTE